MAVIKEGVPFKKVEDAFAITQERGVYRQVDLYEQGGAIFAKKGTGFLKIYEDGHTSKGGVICVQIKIKSRKWVVGRYGILELDK